MNDFNFFKDVFSVPRRCFYQTIAEKSLRVMYEYNDSGLNLYLANQMHCLCYLSYVLKSKVQNECNIKH